MWEKLFDLMAKVFTLTANVDRHEKEIERLRRENKELLEVVNQQSAKIDVLVYAVQSESDKTKMWVEKEMLKFERRLPSGKVENEK
ncbi:MAG: DUF948 domain-containing protein [Pyrinomonadaceae bacterium]|nr:DUF948 domain-containing protein [Pyrinomonadaceae bacterium]